jgi:hypothetical protein
MPPLATPEEITVRSIGAARMMTQPRRNHQAALPLTSSVYLPAIPERVSQGHDGERFG